MTSTPEAVHICGDTSPDHWEALDFNFWTFDNAEWRQYLKGIAAGCGICVFLLCMRTFYKRVIHSQKRRDALEVRETVLLDGSNGTRSRLNSARSRRLRGQGVGMQDERSNNTQRNLLMFSDDSLPYVEREDRLQQSEGIIGNGFDLTASLSSMALRNRALEDSGECLSDTEIRKQEGQHVMTLLFNIGEDQAKRESVRHNGFSCNVCDANPLTGVRYKCANCSDFDVCERCEASCDHDPTHVFIKIRIPIPPLAYPRSTLLQKFYPGRPSLHKPISWNQILDLKEQTYFETSDIESLYDKYTSLCNDNRGISREIYYKCLGPLGMQKNLVLDQIFKFYDKNDNGFIDFEEFVIAISIIARGTQEEKLQYIFHGYDVDKDGYVSKSELFQILNAYYHINVELLKDVIKSCEDSLMTNYENLADKPISSIFKAPIPIDPSGTESEGSSDRRDTQQDIGNSSIADDEMSASLTDITSTSKDSFHSFPVVEAMVKDAIQEMVAGIMLEADHDKDEQLSFEEFADYATVDVSLLSWFEEFAGVF